MGDRRPPPEPDRSSREIPSEMLQEILVKLPTKDVARSCFVSRQWRGVASDPSFRSLHTASYVAPWADAQVLLVTQTRKPDKASIFNFFENVITPDAHIHDEASVYCMSTGKPMAMCSVAIPIDYHLANVCNGLLCFVHRCEAGKPAVVCNPVTGETLVLPRAPPLPTDCIFALGFSPPKREYKLFRLSPPFVDVYTLGDAGGWRQRTDLSLPRPDEIMDWPPQLIDGKLYLLTRDARVLVVDVSTETCRTYHYPEHRTPPPINYEQLFGFGLEHEAIDNVMHNYELFGFGLEHEAVDNVMHNYELFGFGLEHEAVDNVMHLLQPPPVSRPFAMHPFELDGQPCFAVHATGSLRGVQFWVMSPPPEDDKRPQWDLRYSFQINQLSDQFGPSSAWVDDGKMLCYMQSGILYMYGMKAHSPPISNHGRWLRWDQQISLKKIPLWQKSSECRWNIHGGYRPTFLSPLIFTLPPNPR